VMVPAGVAVVHITPGFHPGPCCRPQRHGTRCKEPPLDSPPIRNKPDLAVCGAGGAHHRSTKAFSTKLDGGGPAHDHAGGTQGSPSAVSQPGIRGGDPPSWLTTAGVAPPCHTKPAPAPEPWPAQPIQAQIELGRQAPPPDPGVHDHHALQPATTRYLCRCHTPTTNRRR
jgi:hypothetical protein